MTVYIDLTEGLARPSLGIVAGTTILESTGPAASVPGTHPMLRVSEVFPAPTLVAGRPQRPWAPSSVTREDVGTLHVYVNEVDCSYVRGVATAVDDYQLMDPFGCGPAHIRFPALTGWDQITAGAAHFLKFSYSVDIYLVHVDGSRLYPPLWSGEITGFDQQPSGLVVECVGDLQGPGTLATHKPAQYVPLTDRGTLIARALNSEVVTRRVAAIPTVATGHLAAGRGSSDEPVTSYVQSMLPLGWTVRRNRAYKRVYQLAERTSGSHGTWTFRYGQRGFDCALKEDLTQSPNAIYGRGVQPNGYAWANWKYPGQDASQPAYPNTDPANTISPGETDADTDSGTGVSDLQRRINDLNITADVRVTGTYDAATEAAVRGVQEQAGITVDGIVGGQTWNAMWPLFAGVNIGKEIRLTIAGDDRIVPRLYAPDGTDIGPNPTYRPDLLRIEKEENFGSGITKYDAIVSAGIEFQRTLTQPEKNPRPGWVGTVTARVDFNEGSRWLVREGDHIVIEDFQVDGIEVHVGGVQASPSQGAGAVSFTVDELARDLPTIAAIRRQDEDSKDDPFRLPGRRARRTQVTPDAVEPFDGESSAGVIPRIPLFANLWTVQAIPVSAAGKIAKISLTTTPPCEFYVALFGDEIHADQLARYVGDPTATDSQGRGPYQPNQDTLKALGFQDAIGGPFQPAGYSPGQLSSPWDGGTSDLTGRLESTAPLSYQSVRPPWLWVCFYAAASCYVSGRILPGPIEG